MQNTNEPVALRGTLQAGSLLRQAGKVWLYAVVMTIMALLLSNVLILESLVLRILFNGVLVGTVAMLLYADGGARGEREVALGVSLSRRARDAGYVVPAEEQSKCYNPLKGIWAAVLAALPLLVLGVALAFLAKPYTYTLQDLPSWMGFYRRRADIGAPLAFYAQGTAMALEDYLRLIVRLCSLPFAYVVGGMEEAGSMVIDRWSWLFALILPCAHAIGYLRGPALHAMVLKRNEEAKRKHAKKIARRKKQARRNAGGNKKGPEQLV